MDAQILWLYFRIRKGTETPTSTPIISTYQENLRLNRMLFFVNFESKLYTPVTSWWNHSFALLFSCTVRVCEGNILFCTPNCAESLPLSSVRCSEFRSLSQFAANVCRRTEFEIIPKLIEFVEKNIGQEMVSTMAECRDNLDILIQGVE